MTYAPRPITIMNCHQPVCQHCNKLIMIDQPGFIVHGNINIIDASKLDADGGGIVGSNFPNKKDVLPPDASVSDNVGKMAYHLACLVACLDSAVKEYGWKFGWKHPTKEST